MNRKMIILVLAAAGVLLFALRDFTPVWNSDRDNFYDQAALMFNDPDFCEKINPSAEIALGFNSDNMRGKYMKSHCYYHLALLNKSTDFCAKVAPVRKLWNYLLYPNGVDFDRRYCENSIKTREYQHLGVTLRGPGVTKGELKFFEEAGYAYDKLGKFEQEIRAEFDDTYRQLPAQERANQIYEVYKQALKAPLFIQKVKDLSLYEQVPFDAPHPAAAAERFTAYVGLDNSLPELCEKVSRFAYSGPKAIRNECFYITALNLSSPALCDRIEPAALDSSPQTNPYSNCRSFAETRTGVGMGPSREGDFTELVEKMLKELGIPLPEAHTYPPASISPQDVYARFYDYILHRAPESERLEFIRRIKELK